jgi:hypothetical protein
MWWDQWPGVFVTLGLAIVAGVLVGVVHLYLYWLISAFFVNLIFVTLYAYWRIDSAFPVVLPSSDSRFVEVVSENAPTFPSRRLGYFLVGTAGLALSIHPLVRLTGAFPLNDRCSPAVIGPGRRVFVYVDNDLRSLKGSWGGDAVVTVRNANEFVPLLKVEYSTRKSERADIIYKEKNERAKSVDAFVDIRLPDRSDLVGRIVQLGIVLQIEFPRELGRDSFRYEEATLSSEEVLTVASPAQAALDLWIMVGGLIVGIGLYVLGVAWIFWTNRRIRLSDRPPEMIVDKIEG